MSGDLHGFTSFVEISKFNCKFNFGFFWTLQILQISSMFLAWRLHPNMQVGDPLLGEGNVHLILAKLRQKALVS